MNHRNIFSWQSSIRAKSKEGYLAGKRSSSKKSNIMRYIHLGYSEFPYYVLWKNSIFWSLIFLNPVLIVLKFWKVQYWCLLDVLWCQPIKLIQVVSTSELHEYWWNDVDFIFFVPSACCRDSEASNIDCFKT